jgi:predicted component of type VI protein secretion system
MTQNVGDFPDCDHHNLGECFTALEVRIRELLETVLGLKWVNDSLADDGQAGFVRRNCRRGASRRSEFIPSLSSNMPR